MATWPATLPRPLVSGHALSPNDQTVRTDMESGYARQRRRSSQRVDQLQVTWSFSAAEMTAFRTWFDGDGEGGAVWFTGITLDTGDGQASYTARFAAPWTASFDYPNWMVSARLDIRDA